MMCTKLNTNPPPIEPTIIPIGTYPKAGMLSPQRIKIFQPKYKPATTAVISHVSLYIFHIELFIISWSIQTLLLPPKNRLTPTILSLSE
jgi:hypothetical protein